MSVGGGVFLHPGAPPPNGGQGSGRAAREWREVPASPPPSGTAAGFGGEAPLGLSPGAPSRSLGVNSAEAWPAHLFP